VLTLAAPQDAADVPLGALVTVGLREQEVLRLIVQDVQPRPDLTASLTLVDEAEELHA
jgi:hypothetical protein